MSVSVQAPNGDTVQFPDGTDDATINEAMAKAYGGQTPTPAAAPPPQSQPVAAPATAPNAAPSSTPQPNEPPPNFGAGVRLGEATPVLNAAEALKSGLKSFLPSDLVDNLDKWGNGLVGHPGLTTEQMRDNYDFDQAHLNPDKGGEALGQVVGTLPMAFITKNPWLAGAGSGALTSKPGTGAGGVVANAAEGAVMGKVGQAGMSFLGRVINPMVRPYVKTLLGEGVNLTPGQITGGPLQSAENWMRSAPILGDIIHSAQDRSLTGFNRAAVQRTLTPVGMQLPEGLDGHEAVAYAQQALDDGYNKLLPKLNIVADAPFIQNIKNFIKAAPQQLQGPQAEKFVNTMRDQVISRFSPNGTMTGRTMQDINETLNGIYKNYIQGGPADRELAQAITTVKDELQGLVQRGNPAVAEQISNLRQGWRNLVPVESAAGSAGTDAGGRFSPGGLKAAVVGNDISARNRLTSGGKSNMLDLAEAGQGVLGRSLPGVNSVNRMIAGAGGAAGAFMSHFNPMVLGPALASAAPYTRVGGKMIQTALTSRPTAAAGVRSLVDAVAPHVGVAAAAISPKYKPSKFTGSIGVNQ